jgi:hypothetical protein
MLLLNIKNYHRRKAMPGILISLILLLISVVTAWFNRRGGQIFFVIFLIVASGVFIHHASQHVAMYV